MKTKEFTLSLPQKPWYGDTYSNISLPLGWDVTVCTMPGQDRPKLTKEEIKAAFEHPIGTQRMI